LTAGWTEPAKAQAGDAWQTYLQEIAQEKTPIGRFATPAEVADFFVFLCSERAAYGVGSTYYVDGGWLGVVT
jgi:NAD(P)-dependent dehydrogenase (short-subunit alcohol dehydrogenase family)